MTARFLSFLEAVRRGSGHVSAEYAGWLVPRDPRELTVLEAASAPPVRLPGWVRDELSDLLVELISKTESGKSRSRLAELARYYLRPIDAKDPTASRATLSNWRHDAAALIASELIARRPAGLAFPTSGMPSKGERLHLTTLQLDPGVSWLMDLHPQDRDIALHRGLAEAASEANAKRDGRLLIGVALIAARVAPGTNPEPEFDYDGTPLRGLDGRKFTRSRLALPLVLQCLQRRAVLTHQPGEQRDRRVALIDSYRLVDSASDLPTHAGPLTNLDAENTFDADLLTAGIADAWQFIATGDAQPALAGLTRYAALASGMLTDRHQQDLALLSVAVARRHTDRRALNIDLHRPAFRSDTADSVLFQWRFRRERLLLASHHDPGVDWRHEVTHMGDLLTVRRGLLPSEQARHAEKIQLHLQQGILLRQARELTAAGRPMDAAPETLTDVQVLGAVHAIEEMIESMRTSFERAEEDADRVAGINAHRRKTEADGVIHLLSRIPHHEALASARRLRRDLNRLDEVYADQVEDLRADVVVLWLLAMCDQAIRHGETEQARHYLTQAVGQLPDGIPHLAIRAANIAASISDTELAKRLLEKVPPSRIWPSYLTHLVRRLRPFEEA